MYFKEKSEFLTALFYIEFSNYQKNIKNNLLTKIYDEYSKSNYKNEEFEQIYKELTTNNFPFKIDEKFILQHNGKIFSLEQLLKNKIKIHHFSKSPYVKLLLPIATTNKKHKCLICGNTRQEKFFTYKNSFDYLITYCTNCIKFGISSNLNFYFTINITSNNKYSVTIPATKLSKPQKEISDKILINITNKKNTLVWAVCGAGKTEIIYKTLYEHLINRKKICIAIPRKDVVKELAIRIQSDFKTEINILHGDNKIFNSSSLYIMTTHQLKNYYNFFDLIVLDEVDAFPYNGDKILEYFLNKSLKSTAPILFLSATPSKKIKKFANVIHTLPIRHHQQLLDIPKIHINKKLMTNLAAKKICPQLKLFLDTSLNAGRRILLFVPTIKLLKPVQEMLEHQNYNVNTVSSIDKKREEKITNFKNCKSRILLTTTILERGVTFDYLDVCIFHSDHRHFTKEALIQIAGRVGRKEYDSSGKILFLATEKTKIMNNAIKEITYMNDLAKYRKLWRNNDEMPILRKNLFRKN